MIDMVIGGVLAFNFVILFWNTQRLNELTRKIESNSKELLEKTESIEVEIPGIEVLRDEIFNIMGNMRTPTAMDHLIGGFSQIMMMKAQKNLGLQENIEEPPLNSV